MWCSDNHIPSERYFQDGHTARDLHSYSFHNSSLTFRTKSQEQLGHKGHSKSHWTFSLPAMDENLAQAFGFTDLAHHGMLGDAIPAAVIWHGLLSMVGVINLVVLYQSYRCNQPSTDPSTKRYLGCMKLLAIPFVFTCSLRSVFPDIYGLTAGCTDVWIY